MKFRDFTELLLLAGLWGASFLFMRVLSPLVGPLATADLRMLLGGVFLGIVFLILRTNPGWKQNSKAFLVIGLVNSAIPFLLYSLAALVLPASVEVIINALSPAFGAIAGAWFLGERLTGGKVGGLVLGVAGVVVVAGGLNLGNDPWAWAALIGCVLAPASYAVGGILVKRTTPPIPAATLAFGSQLFAGMVLLPAVGFSPPASLTWESITLLVVFGVLCSGLAYLLYYGLMARIGPTKTLTVTFLMPVFGILWGVLFLGEPVTASLAVGALLILGGTALVVLPK